MIRLKAICDQNESIADKWSLYQRGIAEQNLYFGEPSAYTSAPSGRNNLYQYFLLRGLDILNTNGHLGLVIPSGFYTDKGCQPLRELFFSQSRIDFLYCFENRRGVFNIHRMFKFVLFGTQKGGQTDRFKCAFMMHDPERLWVIETGALQMSVDDIRKFSPSTLTIMEFSNSSQLAVSSKLYGDRELLGDVEYQGQPLEFQLEFMMNEAAPKLFIEREKLVENVEVIDEVTVVDNGGRRYIPLYEGKMVWLFDAEWSELQFYVSEDAAIEYAGYRRPGPRLGYRAVSANTNERTLISTIIPSVFHGNSIVTIRTPSPRHDLFLSAVLSSFCIDFVIRQKITTNVNMHFMRSLPVPGYDSGVVQAVIGRSARLICTSARHSSVWNGAFRDEWALPEFFYPCTDGAVREYGPVHEQEIRHRLQDEAKDLTPEWTPHCGVHDRLPDRRDTGDRAQLRAEIDAYVAHLYGLSRDDFAYILDTFPVLKKKEKKAFGEFMSKRKCLEEYDRIKTIMNSE